MLFCQHFCITFKTEVSALQHYLSSSKTCLKCFPVFWWRSCLVLTYNASQKQKCSHNFCLTFRDFRKWFGWHWQRNYIDRKYPFKQRKRNAATWKIWDPHKKRRGSSFWQSQNHNSIRRLISVVYSFKLTKNSKGWKVTYLHSSSDSESDDPERHAIARGQV